jgi:hypothetical protein
MDNPGITRACWRLLRTRLYSGGSWNAGPAKSLRNLEGLALAPTHVLVLWGLKDRVVPFAEAKVLAQVLPRALMSVHPEADHMGFADGPEVRLWASRPRNSRPRGSSLWRAPVIPCRRCATSSRKKFSRSCETTCSTSTACSALSRKTGLLSPVPRAPRLTRRWPMAERKLAETGRWLVVAK